MNPDLFSVPKTAFLPANIDACALVRMFLPHLHTPKSMFLFRKERLNLEDVKDHDVVVVQRQLTVQNQRAMQMLRESGKKVVYDTDDNLWSLPSYNPAKKAFEAMQEGFDRCIKEAHVVTVSTQGLASALKSRCPNLKAEVLIVPNSLDFNLFYPTTLNRNDDRIIVGWGGSNTHAGDLDEACKALVSTLSKFPKMELQFVGMIPERMQGVERVTYREWVPVGEWANRFSHMAWDIALAPLQDNRFNRSKSNLKMLEAAANRIPCLASDVQPYREFCALGGKEMEWLLCRFYTDWEKKLDRLIRDPLYRNYLGDLMYETAKKYYNIENVKDNWAYAFRVAMQCG